MSGAVNIPLSMTSSGPQPTSIATLNSTIITNAEALAPGLTVLPGGLIEDQTSTGTAIAAVNDQARVDAVNSVTPLSANPFVLAQQGQMLGVPQGMGSNTSVYVVVSVTSGGSAVAGYVIPKGFLVSDGTYQYSIADGGITDSSGSTPSLYAVATQSGSWAVAAGSVTTVVTAAPSGYTITVTNPSAGTAGGSAQTVDAYRTQVLQAQSFGVQGTPAAIKSLLYKVSGVTPRLVSVRQVTGGWEVICGGGDPYEVADAIYQGALDLSTIVGSSTTARNITATITDPPDSYTITFVNPPQQTVTVAATWNTTLSNFTAAAQIQQLAAPALVSYINGITVGQPINELEMEQVFQQAIASVLPAQYLTTLTFAITVNGSSASPTAGTSIIPGDPESYFYCAANGATVAQG